MYIMFSMFQSKKLREIEGDEFFKRKHLINILYDTSRDRKKKKKKYKYNKVYDVIERELKKNEMC